MENPRTDFQTWTRLVYNLLRGHHYLRQTGRGLRTNQIPPSLRGVRDFLSRVASPAAPTAATATLLRANASNWLQTNLQILEQHYEGMVAGIRTNLLRPVNIDHHRAWLVAVRKAVSNFRVDEEVLSTVMDDLIGVGILIQRIPVGSSLRAIQAAPAEQPRLRTDQGPETTTPEAPIPDLTDQPETVTPLDQDPHPTDQDPSPIPRPTTRQNPPGDAATDLTPAERTERRSPRTNDPVPSQTLPNPPPTDPDTNTDRQVTRTNRPPTDGTTTLPTTAILPLPAGVITPGASRSVMGSGGPPHKNKPLTTLPTPLPTYDRPTLREETRLLDTSLDDLLLRDLLDHGVKLTDPIIIAPPGYYLGGFSLGPITRTRPVTDPPDPTPMTSTLRDMPRTPLPPTPMTSTQQDTPGSLHPLTLMTSIRQNTQKTPLRPTPVTLTRQDRPRTPPPPTPMTSTQRDAPSTPLPPTPMTSTRRDMPRNALLPIPGTSTQQGTHRTPLPPAQKKARLETATPNMTDPRPLRNQPDFRRPTPGHGPAPTDLTGPPLSRPNTVRRVPGHGPAPTGLTGQTSEPPRRMEPSTPGPYNHCPLFET